MKALVFSKRIMLDTGVGFQAIVPAHMRYLYKKTISWPYSIHPTWVVCIVEADLDDLQMMSIDLDCCVMYIEGYSTLNPETIIDEAIRQQTIAAGLETGVPVEWLNEHVVLGETMEQFAMRAVTWLNIDAGV